MFSKYHSSNANARQLKTTGCLCCVLNEGLRIEAMGPVNGQDEESCFYIIIH